MDSRLVANAVLVVLGFDHCNGNVRAVVQDVVSKLRFAATDRAATNHEATCREVKFFTKLRHRVPPGLRNRQSDELCSDVLLRERLLVHQAHCSLIAVNLSFK